MITATRQAVAYVAGPYRDSRGGYYVEQNIDAARSIAAELWARGFAVICPHLNTAHFDGLVDDQAFLDGALELLRRSDLVVVYRGWPSSHGTRSELAEALRLGIPVYYWPNFDRPLTADHLNLGEPEPQ